MKYLVSLLIFIFLLVTISSRAAYFSYSPVSLPQPDGTILSLFVSGDEYYQWIHDAEGYTLIQNEDGFYYYAEQTDGQVKPGKYRFAEVSPSEKGIIPWLKISNEEYLQRKQSWQSTRSSDNDSPHSGTINNIVIFIRFADDTEFTSNRQSFEQRFNSLAEPSLRSYYSEVSYNKYTASSTTYPACTPSTNLSYQDSHNRAYFQPYNATSNPQGYNGDNERRLREHALLRDAINWINIYSPVPSNLNLDIDNDGLVDNVCFIIKGSNGGWSSLLWSHSWSLFSFDATINGKDVYFYTFHPETQSGVTTLCHELFHTLGAPDLYHYVNSGLQPAYEWDLMDSGSGHMSAYMKWEYSSNFWIESIPEITSSGMYTLNPLSSSGSNCFKIKSPYSPSQYFVLEYRKKQGYFESGLPGSGLLVYRIDPLINGNSEGPPDELYIFRPDGSVSANGMPENAFLSQESGRTVMNDFSNPALFLQNGTAGGIMISEVSAAGSQVSFRVTISTAIPPSALNAQPAGISEIELSWINTTPSAEVMVAFSTEPLLSNPFMGIAYEAGDELPGGGQVIYKGIGLGFLQTGLEPNTLYYFKIWTVAPGDYYSTPKEAQCYTNCATSLLPYYQYFDLASMPNCWDIQQESPDYSHWLVSVSAHAGGSPFELGCRPATHTGYTRLVLNPFNTSGINKLKVSFRLLYLSGYDSPVLRFQTSNNLEDWTDSEWFIQPALGGNQTPVAVELFLTENLDNPLTYIAIELEGALYAFSGIYIDDLEITIEESDFYVVQAMASPVEGGSVSGSGYYFPGQTVIVHALSNPGYNFLQWDEAGIVASHLPDYGFAAESDRILTARFSMTQVNILALPEPEAGGTVTGGGVYNKYAPVDLTANPAETYEFAFWKEGENIITADEQYSFSAFNSRTLKAVFIPKMFMIGCSVSPDVGGIVLGSGNFLIHQEVVLQAQASVGFVFDGWYEDDVWVSSLSTLAFTAESDRFLEARFHCPACNVTTEADPPQSGIVTGSGFYGSGTFAEVQAQANEGWSFLHWTENGDLLSTQPVYSFLVDRNRALVARFIKIHKVNAFIDPPNAGIVSGSGDYTDGTSVELMAVAELDFEFLAWTENGDTLSHQAVIVFTATTDRNITACFRRVISIPETNSDRLLLYPNPCSETLMIAIPADLRMRHFIFSLINNNGSEIIKQELSTGIAEHFIDMRLIRNGFYIARLLDNDGRVYSYKLSVVK
jgi:M6 family metalloprotease-like protein